MEYYQSSVLYSPYDIQLEVAKLIVKVRGPHSAHTSSSALAGIE